MHENLKHLNYTVLPVQQSFFSVLRFSCFLIICMRSPCSTVQGQSILCGHYSSSGALTCGGRVRCCFGGQSGQVRDHALGTRTSSMLCCYAFRVMLLCRVEYFDDLATDAGSSVDQPSSQDARPVFEPVAVAHKNLHLMGVSLYCDEFPASHRTYTRDPSCDSSPRAKVSVGTDGLLPESDLVPNEQHLLVWSMSLEPLSFSFASCCFKPFEMAKLCQPPGRKLRFHPKSYCIYGHSSTDSQALIVSVDTWCYQTCLMQTALHSRVLIDRTSTWLPVEETEVVYSYTICQNDWLWLIING